MKFGLSHFHNSLLLFRVKTVSATAQRLKCISNYLCSGIKIVRKKEFRSTISMKFTNTQRKCVAFLLFMNPKAKTPNNFEINVGATAYPRPMGEANRRFVIFKIECNETF
jgi:hypothetical protein